MTIPEPALGDVPTLTDPTLTDLRPPTPFVPAAPYNDSSFDDDPIAEVGGLPPAPQEETITELTDEERRDLQQLITVGKRGKTIDVLGFSVRVRNLMVSDDLRIGLYCRPYEDTKMSNRAFQIGVVAAGLQTINDAPVVTSLAPMTPQEEFEKKLAIVENYYPIVLTDIYQAIMDLDQEFAELMVKLGKLKG